MAKEVVLDAERRDGTGRAALRTIRAKGRLPGVIYGTGIEAMPLSVDRHELIRTLHSHGAHALVVLKMAGEEHLALVKEIQIDAVKQLALHVDFLAVRADTAVHTEVALHPVGEPRGVKLGGGVLEVQLRVLAIAALPRSIPEFIEYDVSAMDVGDVVRVSDLTTPEGVTILADPEETLATVSAPRVEIPPTPAEEAAAAEAAAEAEAAAAGGEAGEGEGGDKE